MSNFSFKLKMQFSLLACTLSCCCVAEYIPAWEKFHNWQWGENKPEIIYLPPFVAQPAHNKKIWAGENDFSAVINGGWCDEGLVFFAEVIDSSVENENPDTELWRGDSCEFYITSAGKTPFAIGSRLQVIVAAPDENGNCRAAYYADNMEIPAKYFKATGKRTENGYTVTAFMPWETFGDGAKDIILRDGFRFNMHIDDFEGCIMSLNGRTDINDKKEASPLVKPVENVADGNIYDISPRRNIFSSQIINKKGYIVFDNGEPCTVLLFDDTGRLVSENNIPSGKISIPAPDITAGRMDIITDNNGAKLLTASRRIAVIDVEEATRNLALPDTPSDRILTLGLINAMECLKSPYLFDDLENEFAWRMKQLSGEDISDAPGMLRFLNLMGDPSGAVQTGLARRGAVEFEYTGESCQYAALTVRWGGIPIVYADIFCFENAESARNAVASFRHMRHELDVYLPEADMVYAGRGLTLEGGVPTDMDTEHLVSILDPAAPANITRVTPQLALEYSGAEVFAVRSGADPAHAEIMRNAGLQEISAEEAEIFTGAVIYIGSEGLNIPLRGITYRHTKYGIPDDMIIACKDNIAVQTSYAVPELGMEVIKAVFECKPVSGTVVDRWRQLRLDSLGGDLPELRASGKLVRTGETHSHSLYSDGGSTPGTLLAEAVAGGMDFLILTDHDTISGAVKMTEVMQQTALEFPLITGSEITMNNAYHLNVFPLRANIDKNNKTHAELIAEARAQGAVVMLNHPMVYGINLRRFWYNNLDGSGIDAVERNLEQREHWRQNGYEAAFLGSTDTHYGIFGHGERSAFLLDEVTGEAVAQEILAKRCGMIAPDLPEFVYGSEDLCMAVRAALGDPDLPEYHEKRLDKVFANFDLQTFLTHKVDGHDSVHEWGWNGNPEEITTVIPDRD